MSIIDQIRRIGDRSSARALLNQLEDNQKEDRGLFPEDAERWEPFLPVLRGILEQRYAGEEPEKPLDAAIRFFVTEDRMNAYGCILPPTEGGAELGLDVFGKELQYSGISAGLEQDTALTYLAQKYYLHIFPVARGVPPEDGVDGGREDLFEPRPVFIIDEREGKTADFSEKKPVQLVRIGDTVCRIRPATAGKDGVDVTGRVLPCRPGVPAELPIGTNLQVSEDGLRVEATENGAVYRKEDGTIFVQTAVVRKGTLTKDDHLVWMAFIDGDIPEGIQVTSTSNVLVMGEVRGAQLTSNGSVRVLGGIRKGSRVEAKGQVLAPVIQDSRVKAGKTVIAEEIADSEVAGENVYVLGGEGVIRGGAIRAAVRVECLRVGSPDGGENRFFLGGAEDLKKEIEQLTGELAEDQDTLEKLRKSILNLRMAGGALSMENRGLLDQLTEQKKLYEERVAETDARLEENRALLRAARSGTLSCRELYPLTVVQIGDRSKEFAFPEQNCNIHIYGGQVVSK